MKAAVPEHAPSPTLPLVDQAKPKELANPSGVRFTKNRKGNAPKDYDEKLKTRKNINEPPAPFTPKRHYVET